MNLKIQIMIEKENLKLRKIKRKRSNQIQNKVKNLKLIQRMRKSQNIKRKQTLKSSRKWSLIKNKANKKQRIKRVL